MIGMMVAVALVFDRPFAGENQITGQAWVDLTKHFDHDLTGVKVAVA